MATVYVVTAGSGDSYRIERVYLDGDQAYGFAQDYNGIAAVDPVQVEEFSIRRGSGGRGKWTSGDGTRRVIRFLERMNCAILSGYRLLRPFGLDGGEPGEAGENLVRRADGRLERLQGCDETVLEAGEAIVIVTPTGGGVGRG